MRKKQKLNEQGITLTVLVVTIIVLLILAGVAISVLNEAGILTNSQSAADKYEITDEQDVISVAFSTVFANSALNDSDITTEMLQKELDKTTRKTTVRKSTDTGKENLLYIKFDKTKNEHSVDITNGKIDYIGPYSEITVDILKNAVISMSAEPTALTNGNVTVTITYTLPEDKKGEKDKIVLEYALSGAPTTWNQYQQALTIEENMTVYARLRYLTETTEVPASLAITNIDKLPPLAFTPNVAKTTNSITVTANTTDAPANRANTCSGLAGYSFSKDGGKTWTAYQASGTYAFNNLTQGTTFKILAKAKDNVGNETIGGKNAGTDPIEIPTEEITGKITFGNAVWTKTSNSATVTVNVDKLQTGCNLQYRIGSNGTWTNITSGQSISPGQPSGTKVYARIWDGTNEGPGTGYASTTILDNTKPNTPTIANPSNGNWSNKDIILTIDSSDTESGIKEIQYSYDKVNWLTDWGSSYATNGNKTTIQGTWSAERNNEVFVRAIDHVGNISGISSTHIRIDKTPPIITTATTTTNKILFTTTDNVGIAAYAITESNSVPNTGWTNASGATTYSKTEERKTQNKTYYVWVKDIAGNTNSQQVRTQKVAELKIDISNPDTWLRSKTATITAKDSNYETIRYAINQNPTTSSSSIANKGNVTINSNSTIYAIAYDSTNQAGPTASIAVSKIDTIDPTVNLSKNGGNYVISTEGKTVIGSKVTVSDNGGSGVYAPSLKYAWSQSTTAPTSGWTSFSNGTTISKTDIKAVGTWYLYIQYNDNARNNSKTGILTTRSNAFTISSPSLAIEVIGWEGLNAKMRIIGSGGQLQYRVGGNWQDISSGDVILVHTGRTLYACIFDGNNRYCISNTAYLTYYVQYETNGGWGSIPRSTHIYGQGSPLTRNDRRINREGYEFIGWNTRPDGTGRQFGDGQIIGDLAQHNNETIVLFAQWRRIQYHLTYHGNGGTCEIPDQMFYAGQMVEIQFSPMPEKYGCSFLGWSKIPSATSPEYPRGGSYRIGGNRFITLYAVWGPAQLATEEWEPNYYGEPVHYVTSDGVENWDIFYNDGTNVFLIKNGELERSVGTSVATKAGLTYKNNTASWTTAPRYESTWRQYASKFLASGYALKSSYGNSKCVSTLLSTDNWSSFETGRSKEEAISGGKAIGGPGLKMLSQSMNQKWGTKVSYSTGTYGYKMSNTNSFEINDSLYFPKFTYWLAAPSDGKNTLVLTVNGSEKTIAGVAHSEEDKASLRPVVMLDEDVKTWKGSDGWWWLKQQNKVKYDANGGTGEVPETQSAKKGEIITVQFTQRLTNGTRDFLGWAKDPKATKPEYAYNDGTKTFAMPDEDVTLYAIWSKQVTYDANGGTGSVPETQQTNMWGNNISVRFYPLPTRNEYGFIGWSTDPKATTATYKQNQYPYYIEDVKEDTTLYAIWSNQKITISFDLNGGNGTTPVSKEAYTGQRVTLNSPSATRAGYRFTGWSTSNTSTSGSYYYTAGSSNVVLYACWSNQQTVSYYANGGTGSTPSTESFTINGTATVRFSPLPTKTNYEFLGWSTDSNATTPMYTSNGTTTFTMGMSSVSLYAVWADARPPMPTYQYVSGNNFGNSNQWAITDMAGVPEGWSVSGGGVDGRSRVVRVEYAKDKNGTGLTKWNVDHSGNNYWQKYNGGLEGATGSYFKMPNQDVYIRAVSENGLTSDWRHIPLKRSITYDKNGGYGSVPATQYAKSGDVVTVEFGTKPTKSGYSFLGWSENKTATSATYKEDGTKTFKMGSSPKTLYAVWGVKKVTGITLSTSTTSTTSNNLTLYATVTPDDAANKGVTWSSSDSSIATVNASGVVTRRKAGSVTITATAADGSGVSASATIRITTSKTKCRRKIIRLLQP